MNEPDFTDRRAERRDGNPKGEGLLREGEPLETDAVETPRREDGALDERDRDLLVSEAAGVPLLTDDAAPLSSALHVPTLVKDLSTARKAQPRPDNPAPFSSFLNLPVLIGDSRSDVRRASTYRTGASQAISRADPVAETRSDSTLPASGLFSGYDWAASAVAALMILGPLFAGAFGRING